MNPYWIKLSTNFDIDDRVSCILGSRGGDAVMFYYIRLLLNAGRNNLCGGVFMTENIPHTAKTLANQWHLTESRIKGILDKLESVDLIEIENGVIYISDWADIQSADKLEQIREYERERKRKYREMRKQKCPGNVPNCPNTEKEKEIETEKEKEIELEEDEDDIYESVKARFNIIAAAIPKIISLSDKQRTAIRIILDKYGEELLNECFRIVGESEFLQGRNAKNWVPTFDWLMNPDNFSKVINGNYSAVYAPSEPSENSAPSADSDVYHSFESDEFIEAALTRGFGD